MKIITTGFVATALLSAVLSHQPATAQTATNLNCNGCVNTNDIANDSITPAKLRDGAVGPVHLGPGAKPAGGDFSEPVDLPLASGAVAVVASVTLNLPGPGVVILNSGGFVIFNDNPSGVVCTITKGTTLGNEPIVVSQNHNVANARRMPVATTRGFHETTAGVKTYNFVCQSQGSTALFDVILTAFFGPRRY